jgi:methanogenic corrinoid protein MtbC1
MEQLDLIKEQLVDFDADGIKTTIRKALDQGANPLEIIDSLWEGMKEVGRRYETGEFFFAELTMAGKTMKEAMRVLRPAFRGDVASADGNTVVIGTVKGDLHDIGKDLVVNLLVGGGIRVLDLGVDVPKEKFVEAAQRESARVIGLSALLSTTIIYAREVVDAFKEAGLRDRVKIIVGGAAATEEQAKLMGADAYADDAVTGVSMIRNWLAEG